VNTAEVLDDPALCDEGRADDGIDGPLPYPGEDATEEPAGPVPVLTARGLGHHELFRAIEVDIYPGEVIALTGTPGSGRTVALLSLAGNFKHSHGTVDRKPTALGLVRGVHEPEPVLTAREHLDERLRLLRPFGLPTRARRARHRAALDEAVQRLGGDADRKTRELTPLERHLLMIELALVADPAVIAVDEADVHLTLDEQRILADALRATGRSAVITARDATAYAPDQIVEITR
jgi:ABC-2 type transport system ATP-binding protein